MLPKSALAVRVSFPVDPLCYVTSLKTTLSTVSVFLLRVLSVFNLVVPCPNFALLPLLLYKRRRTAFHMRDFPVAVFRAQ